MREFKGIRRVVVKIGTNTICNADGRVDHHYIDNVARQILDLNGKDVQVIIVTSGAIGSGSTELGLNDVKKDLAVKQACAAVGQSILMMAWRDAFARRGRCVGQVLLTYGAFSDRKRYLDLKRAFDEMFLLGVVPVVNENDVIATDEIEETFGDNDKLSALVASKMDADLLIILTDVDGLYDRDPEADPDAKLITTVDEITKDIERIAGTAKSDRSVGGMRTKINAARIAMESGFSLVIAKGRAENVLTRVVAGEEMGTLFTPRSRYSNKERWILFASPKGKITVDDGAEKALRAGKSLLPCGITSISGKFKAGDIVRINGFAKGIANFTAADMEKLVLECGKKRPTRIGNDKVAIDHENIVLLD